ncbi:endophilin-A3b [Cyprinodon tularosa]|uniref:endophilin-A3b n=1 Tax=Cyprinodon tularosa TaxID=77115 RepID=UPI0018E20CE4|nr:endophilin-A3b [Cyprinodon tularosa]
MTPDGLRSHVAHSGTWKMSNIFLFSGGNLTVVPSGPGSPISSCADSQPVVDQPCCRALYSFMPNREGELDFSRGDIILLTGQVDSNWYQGSLGGRSGLLPVNYVDVLVRLPSP